MIRRALRRTVFFAYIALVFASTLAPLSGDMYRAVSGLDKLAHVVLFSGVAFVTYWSQKAAGEPSPLFAAGFAAAMAALIELIQSALPYRSGDIWDFFAGLLGAVLGAAVGYFAAVGKHRIQRDPG